MLQYLVTLLVIGLDVKLGQFYTKEKILSFLRKMMPDPGFAGQIGNMQDQIAHPNLRRKPWSAFFVKLNPP